MLKLNYFLADIFILSAEKQPIKLSWRKIEWLPEPEVIKPGQEADIVISVDASKLVGKPEKFHAPLILDGVTGRPSDRTLSIEINLIDK